MILVKAPLRISLGGGGTDLPSYYERFGSTFLSASIDKFVYLAIHRNFGDGIIVKYSEVERVRSLDELRHPLVRECLKMTGQDSPVEIVSFADIPGGTGLGSSGAFTVALLKGLYTRAHHPHTTADLASAACEVEMTRLAEPVGKQDPFASAFGGLRRFDIDTAGKVTVSPVPIPASARLELEDRMVLFFTGQRRSASAVLRHQDEHTRGAVTTSAQGDMLQNLHETRELGLKSFELLSRGDLEAFGRLMSVQWEQKRRRSPGSTNPELDRIYELGLKNGAVGGKLIGAGGGGFMLFLADDKRRLRAAMHEAGLQEALFRFEELGAQVMVSE